MSNVSALIQMFIGWLIMIASVIGYSAANPMLHALLGLGIGIGLIILGLGFARAMCGDKCRSNNNSEKRGDEA